MDCKAFAVRSLTHRRVIFLPITQVWRPIRRHVARPLQHLLADWRAAGVRCGVEFEISARYYT